MSIPSVFVIGTCRAHTPLYVAAQLGLVRLIQISLNHYLHSTSEARQLIAYLHGEFRLEPMMRRFLFDCQAGMPAYGTPFNLDALPEIMPAISVEQMRRLFSMVDVVLLEISNLKRYQFCGVNLQGNFVNKFLREQVLSHDDAILRELFASNPVSRLPCPMYPSLLDKFRCELHMQDMDELELAEDLDILHRAIPHLAVCSHFTTPDMPAPVLESRQCDVEQIKRACAVRHIPFFNPNSALEVIDSVDRVLHPGDWHHYSKQSELLLAHYYSAGLSGLPRRIFQDK